MLLPWAGSNVVFLTTPGDFDERIMARWVRALDDGWTLYADLTGRRPAPLKAIDGKVTIAAVPDFDFTCGAGCGFVGASGIELAIQGADPARHDSLVEVAGRGQKHHV